MLVIFIVKLKVKCVISVLVAKENLKTFIVSKQGEETLFSTPEGVTNVHY